MNRENTFKLHYFPEIPLNPPEKEPPVNRSGVQFKRLGFAADGESDSEGCQRDRTGIPTAEGPQRNLKQIETEAFMRGFARGEKAGFDAAGSRIELLLEALSESVARLDRLKKEIRHSSEIEIVELALAIARKIVCREVATRKEVIVDIAKEAMKKVEDQEEIKIKMNPTDLEYLQQAGLNLSKFNSSIDNIQIQAEDTIEDGGCIIETGWGEIDARIDRQLQVVEEAFREELQKIASGADS